MELHPGHNHTERRLATRLHVVITSGPLDVNTAAMRGSHNEQVLNEARAERP